MKSKLALAALFTVLSPVSTAPAFAGGGSDPTASGCKHYDFSFPWDPLDQLSVAGQVATEIELSQPKEDPQKAPVSGSLWAWRR